MVGNLRKSTLATAIRKPIAGGPTKRSISSWLSNTNPALRKYAAAFKVWTDVYKIENTDDLLAAKKHKVLKMFHSAFAQVKMAGPEQFYILKAYEQMEHQYEKAKQKGQVQAAQELVAKIEHSKVDHPLQAANTTNETKFATAKTPTKPPRVLATNAPTISPTNIPTSAPTNMPTNLPTDTPTDAPTDAPSNAPSIAPTNMPTDAPTLSDEDLGEINV
jgi:hypothetical protein